MARVSDRELKPRNGHTLMVGITARISGCANQKELSLEDQTDNAKDLVAEMYDGPVEYVVIATKGKGELLTRPELKEVEDLLRTKTLDLFVQEDVGRLVRGAAAVRLWGIGVDHGVQCIAPHDACDTAEDDWEKTLLNACASHVSHNEQTSRRLKHKLMNRFKKMGAAVALVVAGYIKPEDAQTYDDWRTMDEWTETIQRGLDMLSESGNCSAVADFFNDVGFPAGPHCKNAKWDGRMVRRYYQNPLLAGKPGRGFRSSIKHHETGRRMSVKNTKSEPVYYDAPHLAHVKYVQLAAVNQLIDKQNENYSRRRPKGIDPMARKVKKRTRFPGQHGKCWYCGRALVWGGNGVTDSLMCTGSRDWLCWNSIGVKGANIADQVVDLITCGLHSLDVFDDQFAALVELATAHGDLAAQRARIEERTCDITQQFKNITNAIATCGLDADLQRKREELKAEQVRQAHELSALEALEQQGLQLPASAAALRQPLVEQFKCLARESWQLGELLQQLVPEMHVYLVRLPGDNRLLPRARVKLNLAGHIRTAYLSQELIRLTESSITIDLFERPVHERIRKDCVRLAAEHESLGAIAAQLDGASERDVKRALDLHQRMADMGLDDPYILLTSPPDDLNKFRRHRNPRYEFTPLEGYEPPPLM